MLVYYFVDKKLTKWGTFDEKYQDKAIAFLNYIRTLKNYTEFTLLTYTYNPITKVMTLVSVEPITENTQIYKIV